MSRRNPGRIDIHQEVTDRIVAELEAGAPPWVQPWSCSAAPLGLPRNALTGRAYSEINILLLWHAMVRGGFRTQYWLTFRQAQLLGGRVCKGERGTLLLNVHRPREDEDEDGALPHHSAPFLHRFTVFNVTQCEGLDAQFEPSDCSTPLAQERLDEAVNDIFSASGIDFTYGAADAFYSPWDDMIHLPSRNWFDDPVDCERVFLHELIHATGHETRLGRDLSNPFGSPGYAQEELIAELGAAYLCAEIGIAPTVRHASYIDSWLDVLRGDNRAIFKAASAASRACAWLRHRRDAQTRAADAYEAGMVAEDAALNQSEPAMANAGVKRGRGEP